MSAPASDVLLGGRYRLLERVARGGMGTVWRAMDETLDRPVAVKILNENLLEDERFIERFRREARAAAGLSHPSVGGVFDYGEDDGRPYLVMELLDGETLAERLAREGPLPPTEAARIGAAVADALAAAHGAGIVHRDVKPANVMLSPPGGVKVMDFGIATSVRSSATLTATGTVLGTATYLSPEQARGERATAASDVYALGVVLYEMLTGAPPFAGPSAMATAAAHISERPAPVREARPEVPQALAAVAEACLAKDPAGRPESAADVAVALRDASGPAVSAATPGEAAAPEVLHGDGGRTDPLAAAIAEGAATAPIGTEPTARLPRHPSLQARQPPNRRWVALFLGGVVAAAVVMAAVLAGSGDAVRTPAFRGKTLPQAQAMADRAGLLLQVVARRTGQPKGTVVGQLPEAGTTIVGGGTVALVVSAGPRMVTVPAVAGLSPGEAQDAIEDAGLVFAGFELVPDAPPGIVGSSPEAGTDVPEGTSITVLVGDRRGHGNGDGRGND